jgi:hypothetical protein
MGVRALTLYPLPGRTKLLRESLRKAREWLVSVTTNAGEERAMRLMGLVWTNASRHTIESAMEDVVTRQRADGGWSQLDSLPADAYATGMSLCALHEAGISVTDPLYRKGIECLLKSQYASGVWLVKSRAYPVQPYFDSGFPFGQHQWISAAGSSWASLAIAHTLPMRTAGNPKRRAPSLVSAPPPTLLRAHEGRTRTRVHGCSAMIAHFPITGLREP